MFTSLMSVVLAGAQVNTYRLWKGFVITTCPQPELGHLICNMNKLLVIPRGKIFPRGQEFVAQQLQIPIYA